MNIDWQIYAGNPVVEKKRVLYLRSSLASENNLLDAHVTKIKQQHGQAQGPPLTNPNTSFTKNSEFLSNPMSPSKASVLSDLLNRHVTTQLSLCWAHRHRNHLPTASRFSKSTTVPDKLPFKPVRYLFNLLLIPVSTSILICCSRIRALVWMPSRAFSRVVGSGRNVLILRPIRLRW